MNKKKIVKKICCVLCSLVNLFSANKENTWALGFRDICRYSAKGTAFFWKHYSSWGSILASTCIHIWLLYHSPLDKRAVVVSGGLFTLGLLNTCDMIYEHIESKNQETKKTSENDNKTVNKGESKRS